MTGSTRAVFLSYASQDAVAARRISDALRSAGIEVWFDQSELRGGNAWEQRIRQQIRDCALFVPVISATTTARPEGYFRLEWSHAEQRSHVIAHNKAFIVPVCLDQTAESGADVPESFQRVPWTRLPGGHATAAFVERVGRLLAPAPGGAPTAATAAAAVSAPLNQAAAGAHRQSRSLLLLIVALITVVIAYYLVHKYFFRHDSPLPATPPAKITGDSATHTSVAPAASATAEFAPPPHSIAVLPFVNMSGAKQQDYLSDGLTEELLTPLSRIDELQGATRTSAFFSKAKLHFDSELRLMFAAGSAPTVVSVPMSTSHCASSQEPPCTA